MFALMVGLGEVYFVAAAARISASPLELGLVVGLPLAAGGLGSLVALTLIGRLRKRRAVVLLAVALQLTSLVALAGLAATARLTPSLLIACACLYHASGMAAGTAWSSWFGDLVPEEERGRFFSSRARRVQAAMCIGLAGGGFGLQWLEQPLASDAGPRLTGFAVLFALAAAARLCSFVLLFRSREPEFTGLGSPRQLARFVRTRKGSLAWRVLTVGAVLQLVTYLASPFFAPFMLMGLKLSYVEYMAATLTVVVAKVLVLPRWGVLVDEVGARRAYALAAVMVALVPLPWLWANSLLWVLVAQAFSGASWASYEISVFTVQLDASVRRTRPMVFAAQSVLNGSAQLAGSTLGGIALAAMSGRWQAVFALSLALRLCVALAVPWLIPHLGSGPRSRRQLALRLIGFRAHGGASFRPVDPPASGPEAPRPPGAAARDGGPG